MGMRIWVAPVVATVLAMAYVGLTPTDDGSYRCDDPPIVRMVRPEPERSDAEFFDQGTRCNADLGARRRALAVVGVLGVGATAAAVVVARRNERLRSATPPAPGGGETDPFRRPVRSRSA